MPTEPSAAPISLKTKRDATAALRQARAYLNSPAFLLWIENQSGDVKTEGGNLMMTVATAYTIIVTKKLAEIRTQLDLNRTAINEAITSMNEAVDDANDAVAILAEIAKFVGLLKPILGLL